MSRSYWSQFPEKEKLLKEKVDFDVSDTSLSRA